MKLMNTIHDAYTSTRYRVWRHKALFNVGFYILNPTDNIYKQRERKWNLEYARAEWQWYLSGDRNITKAR